MEESVGDYYSPTLLINGFTVMGRSAAGRRQMSCSLDLPNEKHTLAAILGLRVLSCENAAAANVVTVAFHLLFRTGQPVALERICRETGRSRDEVTTEMKVLQCKGHVELDDERHIVAVDGLSSIPTKHKLSIDGRQFQA